jgi:hypothetical protein
VPARRADHAALFRPRAGRRRHRRPAGLPRRALTGLPQQARAGGAARRRRLLRRQPARAADGEHIAFAVGARRIGPLGRLPGGVAENDRREAVGLDAAQVAVADYRPGWCPANTAPLIRQALAALLTGGCGEPTVALGRGRAGAADRDV